MSAVGEIIARWQFRRGFRAGYADAVAKRKREVFPGSRFAQGYRLGVGAYSTGLPCEDSMEASVRGVFYSERSVQ